MAAATTTAAVYTWGELAAALIPYVQDLGFTHVELMPVTEHPFDGSWGYQVTGYFAPTARFGTPDDFRAFVDACHQAGIGVILDWVPAHFPKDDSRRWRASTAPRSTSTPTRARASTRDWGTLIFNYGRNEVRNFLLANALFWLDEYHIDGLRVDAVASMLYLDYSPQGRASGSPTSYGGRENLEAIDFLRELNIDVHGELPGVLTIAEESTAWPAVSRPIVRRRPRLRAASGTWAGCTTRSTTCAQDPIHRQLPPQRADLRPDVRVHARTSCCRCRTTRWCTARASLLGKMPGDDWQKFANLRAALRAACGRTRARSCCSWAASSASGTSGTTTGQLDWDLLAVSGARRHAAAACATSTACIASEPALHQLDFEPRGFRWIDCHDADQSVLSFVRQGQDDAAQLVALFNFTPVPRRAYRIGVPSGARVGRSAQHRLDVLRRQQPRQRPAAASAEPAVDGIRVFRRSDAAAAGRDFP